MRREIIVPKERARITPLYSPAVRVGNLLFCSGSTGSDPITRATPPDIIGQTRLALENLKSVVEAGGASFASAVKVMIYMTDMVNEFSAMNEVYLEYFPSNPPARSTVGVAHLARPVLKVEIEMIAEVFHDNRA
jgi:2-iminobutanoate/2-iminopropanoate deaminase